LSAIGGAAVGIGMVLYMLSEEKSKGRWVGTLAEEMSKGGWLHD
jgi:hypothetical protein